MPSISHWNSRNQCALHSSDIWKRGEKRGEKRGIDNSELISSQGRKVDHYFSIFMKQRKSMNVEGLVPGWNWSLVNSGALHALLGHGSPVSAGTTQHKSGVVWRVIIIFFTKTTTRYSTLLSISLLPLSFLPCFVSLSSVCYAVWKGSLIIPSSAHSHTFLPSPPCFLPHCHYKWERRMEFYVQNHSLTFLFINRSVIIFFVLKWH